VDEHAYTDEEREQILLQIKEGFESILDGVKIGANFIANEIKENIPPQEKVLSDIKALVQKIKPKEEVKVAPETSEIKEGPKKGTGWFGY
ncbi:MAG: hypothetical protein JSS09_02055, partial [Verrucomicrobia bacterium]|nr:hypothetical protein [Verrucomicrobiota bacterium]